MKYFVLKKWANNPINRLKSAKKLYKSPKNKNINTVIKEKSKNPQEIIKILKDKAKNTIFKGKKTLPLIIGYKLFENNTLVENLKIYETKFQFHNINEEFTGQNYFELLLDLIKLLKPPKIFLLGKNTITNLLGVNISIFKYRNTPYLLNNIPLYTTFDISIVNKNSDLLLRQFKQDLLK